LVDVIFGVVCLLPWVAAAGCCRGFGEIVAIGLVGGDEGSAEIAGLVSGLHKGWLGGFRLDREVKRVR
jgi:hypothetical protein